MKFLNRGSKAFRERANQLALIGLLTLFTGCSESGPDLAPVSGIVTLDGQPLPSARVTFIPKDSEVGLSSVAETDGEGKFTLKSTSGEEGAFVGTHQVRVTTLKIVEEDGEMKTVSEEKVPSKYNVESEVSFDVPAEGTSEANFEFESS